jgi:hypothetical protein
MMLGNIIMKIDALGKPVSLNYQGKSKYKTACGGLLTIIIAVIVGFYFF